MEQENLGSIVEHAATPLAKSLKKVTMPLLVIHGDRDGIVPIQLGREVYEHARAPKDFYLVRGAGHNDLTTVGGRPYFQRLRAFISQAVR